MLKLIVSIDGIDGSGKETTSRLVHEMLEERGYRVKVISPPFYDEPSGAAIKDILTCGNVAFPTRRMVSSLYEVDRNIYMAKHAKELINYDILLYNRSWLSNLFYQTAKKPSGIMDVSGYPVDERFRVNQAISHIVQGYFAEIAPWTIGGRDGDFKLMKNVSCLNIVLNTPMDLPSVETAIMDGIIKRGTPDVNEQVDFLKSIWENIDFLYMSLLGRSQYVSNICETKYMRDDFEFYIKSCMKTDYDWPRSDLNQDLEWPKIYRSIANFFQFWYVGVFESAENDSTLIRRSPEEIAKDTYTMIELRMHGILNSEMPV